MSGYLKDVQLLTTVAQSDLPNGHRITLEEGQTKIGAKVFRATIRDRLDDRIHWDQRWTTLDRAQRTFERIHKEKTKPTIEVEDGEPLTRSRPRPTTPEGWGRFG